MLTLYTYFRSSAAYRVRIALNLKRLDYTAIPVHLLRGGGEQHAPFYATVNPQGLVPALQDAGVTITQSLAIMEYLEEIHPSPALLPASATARARVRSLAHIIACDIHPLDNLRVLRYLEHEMSIDKPARDRWYRHWIAAGFAAIEQWLAQSPAAGRCCEGDAPTLADCCLIPQVYNAQRLRCRLEDYPRLMRINDHCLTLDAFRGAAPAAQPDAD